MPRDPIADDAAALRRLTLALARPASTTPIPGALRTRIVALARRAAAAGWSQAAVAAAVGVSVGSLQNWQRRPAALPLVPVVVAPPATPVGGALTLVAPSGHRLEGLDVPTAAALLRALG